MEMLAAATFAALLGGAPTSADVPNASWGSVSKLCPRLHAEEGAMSMAITLGSWAEEASFEDEPWRVELHEGLLSRTHPDNLPPLCWGDVSPDPRCQLRSPFAGNTPSTFTPPWHPDQPGNLQAPDILLQREPSSRWPSLGGHAQRGYPPRLERPPRLL